MSQKFTFWLCNLEKIKLSLWITKGEEKRILTLLGGI